MPEITKGFPKALSWQDFVPTVLSARNLSAQGLPENPQPILLKHFWVLGPRQISRDGSSWSHQDHPLGLLAQSMPWLLHLSYSFQSGSYIIICLQTQALPWGSTHSKCSVNISYLNAWGMHWNEMKFHFNEMKDWVHECLTTQLLPEFSHISGSTRTSECPCRQNTGLDFLGSCLHLTRKTVVSTGLSSFLRKVDFHYLCLWKNNI